MVQSSVWFRIKASDSSWTISGQEYFFHQSACVSFASLREGQAVTFQTGQGPKGPRAENVREV